MATGVIKTLQREKQFGFLRDSNGAERFFHHTVVAKGHSFDDLAEGQRVEFEPDEGPKGLRAKDVRPPSSSAWERHV